MISVVFKLGLKNRPLVCLTMSRVKTYRPKLAGIHVAQKVHIYIDLYSPTCGSIKRKKKHAYIYIYTI